MILYLYYELGIEFIHELNGDFAIAILDQRINRLYLIRDRLGIKPLYYSQQEGSIAFASEIKSLHSLFPDSTLSEKSIQSYFVFKYVPGQDTLFAGIKRLPPGSMGIYDIDTGRFTIEKYWEPAIGSATAKGSYQDLTAQLRNLLETAVQLRLISDVPVGTFLSGGLDSSRLPTSFGITRKLFITAREKKIRISKKKGLHLIPFYADLIARKWGLDIRYIDISGVQATREFISKTLYYSDDLIADGSQIPSYMIAEKARETSKVMLSGMGADEIFLGYASHMLSLMALYFDRLPGWLSGR